MMIRLGEARDKIQKDYVAKTAELNALVESAAALAAMIDNLKWPVPRDTLNLFPLIPPE
jgi:hypothetical protein